MRFGGYFPFMKDKQIRSVFLDFGGGDSDDNDDSDSGGNTDVVQVSERSFQSPGSKSGGDIDRSDRYYRGKSDLERKASRAIAGTVMSTLGGAVLGPAGSLAGRQLGRHIADSSTTYETDAQGNRLNGGGSGGGYGGDRDNNSGGNMALIGKTLEGGNGSGGGHNIPGAIGGAVSEELQGLRESIAEQRRQFDIGQGNLEPFREAGQGALSQQQALLGLSGVDAQQQAFDQFNESPGQAFLRKRGQKALLANASATGGLGGGNVKSALQQQGIGFAQQQLNNQMAQLSGISGTGQSTAVTQAGLGQQFAGNVGQMQQSAAQSRASGLLAQQAMEQQQRQADSAADAQRNQQLIGLAGQFAKPAFDFIGGLF